MCWPRVVRAEPPSSTIRLWHAYSKAEKEALLTSVAAFEQTHPGTTVETLALPHDAYAAKLAAAIPRGQGPDLFIDSHERLGDFRRKMLVAPVGDAFSPEGLTPAIISAVELDGQIWGVPLAQKSLVLFVNSDLVERTPATLEGIVALSATLPPDVVGLAYDAMSVYAHAPLLHAFGGQLLGPEDSFGMVGPEAEGSVEFALAMLDAGVVPHDADGALVANLLRSGKAAFAISGPWLSDIPDDLNYRVELLPTVAATGLPLRPFVTVESAMLSPDGAKRPQVRALARYLASAEAARLRQRVAGAPSVRTDVEAGTANMRAFAAQAHAGVIMPTSAAMRATWEPAKQALRKTLRGQSPISEALEEARRRFEDVRRPPPPPASPWPMTLVLGMLSLWGCLVLVRRARDPEFRREVRRSIPAYRYVAHAVLAVGVLVIAPLAVGAISAVFAGPTHNMHYAGLGNFVEILTARGGDLLGTGSFYVVLLVTIAWTLINVAFHLGLGLSIGLLLSRPVLRMRAVYRVLLIVPWAVPSYVTALAWKGMFHRQFGAVTGLIESINELLGTSLEPISWFAQFSTAFTANIATNVWLGFPFMMVVTIGAFTGVPKDVLEAAEVDGASRWQRLRYVTLPIIRPALMPAVTLGAIWTFNMFNVVFLVSGGDPDGATDILVSDAYRWAFTREAQVGYAAAYAVLIFVLLFGGTRLIDRYKARWAGSGRGGAS